MRKESLRTIGIMMMFVAVAMLILYHNELSALFDVAMTGQADSMMDQLLR